MHSVADNLAWIESLSPWPKEFGLGRIRELLAAVGDPQDAFQAIHVVGTNGKTTTTRLITHILSLTGRTVGMTCTDGIYISGRRIDDGDCSGPQSARSVPPLESSTSPPRTTSARGVTWILSQSLVRVPGR